MLFELDSPPKLENVEIAALYQLWLDKRRSRSGSLPARSDFDIVEIAELCASLIPDIWMIDVVPPGPRFRFRLIGGSLFEAGAELRVGDFVDEVENTQDPESLTSDFQLALVRKLPSYRAGVPLLTHSRYSRRVERLSVPLANDGINIDLFLCATHYEWTPRDLTGFSWTRLIEIISVERKPEDAQEAT